MKYSDEVLMAYVDGELDGDAAAAIEAALAQDADLAARVGRQRALRRAVHAAFEPVLAEPMPQRLRATASGAAAEPPRARRWSWFEWGAMAASLAIGAVLGALMLNGAREAGPLAADLASDAAGLRARGALAQALQEQLGATQAADAPVTIGVSFVSDAGEYCRSFAYAQLGGLACRRGGEWRLAAVAELERRVGADRYRQAAAPMPPAVLRAVEQRIRGEALDAAAEHAARQRGWER